MLQQAYPCWAPMFLHKAKLLGVVARLWVGGCCFFRTREHIHPLRYDDRCTLAASLPWSLDSDRKGLS